MSRLVSSFSSSGFEHHDRDLAAVIGFAPMGGAPVAEEALLLGVGAGLDGLDLLQTQSVEPIGGIGLEIEAVMERPLGGDEEAGIAGLARHKAVAEFLTDLIGGLADRRPDGGNDMAAMPAKPLDLVDGRFEYPADRALPTGM